MAARQSQRKTRRTSTCVAWRKPRSKQLGEKLSYCLRGHQIRRFGEPTSLLYVDAAQLIWVGVRPALVDIISEAKEVEPAYLTSREL